MAEERKKRLKLIADLIRQNEVPDQEDLGKRLLDKGVVVSQATLSRDLAALGVRKIRFKSGQMGYCMPQEVRIRGMERGSKRSSDAPVYPRPVPETYGFQGISFASSLIVVRTLPGYAARLSIEIDTLLHPGIAGCVAGTDTILIAVADGHTKEEVLTALSDVLPEALLFF